MIFPLARPQPNPTLASRSGPAPKAATPQAPIRPGSKGSNPGSTDAATVALLPAGAVAAEYLLKNREYVLLLAARSGPP